MANGIWQIKWNRALPVGFFLDDAGATAEYMSVPAPGGQAIRGQRDVLRVIMYASAFWKASEDGANVSLQVNSSDWILGNAFVSSAHIGNSISL
jgi:hypothetical protein